jgi:LacI family gluconate utilization system Gnt-I transcriptional repressor
MLSVQLSTTRVNLHVALLVGSPEDQAEHLSSCLGANPAGIIMLREPEYEECRKLLNRANCPVLFVLDVQDSPQYPVVGIDHVDAGYLATKHLLDQGYNKVAYLAPRPDWRILNRMEGVRKATREAGFAGDEVLLTADTVSTVKAGADLLNKVMKRHPDCDAIFCNDSSLALGVLFEAQRQGIDIPGELGICGFGGADILSACEPTITTLMPNYEEMAEAVFRLFMWLLENPDGTPAPNQVVIVHMDLLEAESSRRGKTLRTTEAEPIRSSA